MLPAQANQWQVAKAGGVEAVVACMTAFPTNALVQLSTLLCMIPLALDNPSLQAHVATLALPAVIAALRTHAQHADVQAKGLVVLGVLGQVPHCLLDDSRLGQRTSIKRKRLRTQYMDQGQYLDWDASACGWTAG